jgi:outer membrane protein
MRASIHVTTGLIAILSLSGAVMAQTSEPGAETMTLSLEQARQLTLEKNYAFQSRRLQPLFSEAGISVEKGTFDPTLSARISQSHTETPNRLETNVVNDSVITNSYSVPPSDGVSGWVSLGKKFTLGTDVSLTAQTSKTEQDDRISAGTDIGIDVTQPLLRNFGREITNGGVLMARNYRDQSLTQLEIDAVAAIQTTENAYWDLVLTVEVLNLARLSLKEKQQLLESSRAKAESGAEAQYNVLVAEAEVAQARQEIISAQSAVGREQDRLKTYTGIAQTPQGWQIEIKPTEQPMLAKGIASTDSLFRKAMSNRPEVRMQTQQLAYQKLSLKVNRNQLLPILNATGGVTLKDGSSLKYSESLNELASASYPSWDVGLRLVVPLGNNAAEGRYRRQQLQLRQIELGQQTLELTVREEVRGAVRQVRSTMEQIEAAKVTIHLREANLDNQRERLRLGLTTNYEVLTHENELARARRSLLGAQIEHQKSNIDLQVATGELLSSRGISVTPGDVE